MSAGYWCLWCGHEILPEIVERDDGTEGYVYVHDDVEHPIDATYDEDGAPQ